jgi:hypothetical protein
MGTVLRCKETKPNKLNQTKHRFTRFAKHESLSVVLMGVDASDSVSIGFISSSFYLLHITYKFS